MDNYKVNLVRKGYVSDDCIQLMEPFRGSYMTIVGDDLKYHFSSKKSDFLNSYLDDSRRFSFPYYNIPTHVEKDIFEKINYINQIYDFDKRYVIVKDGNVIGRSVFKLDSGEAVTISELLKPNFTGDNFGINIYDVQDLISSTITDDAYVLSNNGLMCSKDEASYSIIGLDYSSIVYVTPSVKGAVASGIKIYRTDYNDKRFDVILFDLPFAGFIKYNAEVMEGSATFLPEPKVKRRYNRDIDKESILSARTMARYKNN